MARQNGIGIMRLDRGFGARQVDAGIDQQAEQRRVAEVDAAGRPLLSSTIRYAGDRYRLRTGFSRPRSAPARGARPEG